MVVFSLEVIAQRTNFIEVAPEEHAVIRIGIE